MQQRNVGILGFGFIGKVHAYGYRTLPFFYEPLPFAPVLHAVCTSRPETAEAAREQMGFAKGVTDYRAITEDPDIDIVHIATPNSLHRDALLSAMAAGKHIYCEKPLVANAAEADDIEAAARDYKGILHMVFHTRFSPVTLRARELVEAGFLGRVLSFRACYLHSGSANPKAPLKWKLARDMGGGVLMDLGSHVLDLLRHLVGDFAEILCRTQIAYADRPAVHDPDARVAVAAEDAALMLLRLPDGAVGSVEASKIATGIQDELRVEIHGTRGALRFNLMDGNALEIYDTTQPAGPTGGRQGWQAIDTVHRYPKPALAFPGPKFPPGWMRAHVACLHSFLHAVARNEPARPGLAEGLYVQRVMDAAVRSEKENRWIPL